ncbi:hypothetical protein [Flavobacterium hungaricum]|uniref:Uncharacterized protein n=1 Tax=Flavobacterium hungaricum TaxID=2082725 RepID=A0ABR9TH63_9FLAO|nr:hypothetical protein [Flavobacterium hungaricum]MBE8724369.1 hypothetical protein [Flavobacterium hungaricum]
MERTALTKEELDDLKQKIRSYERIFYGCIVVTAFIFYGFYYFNSSEKNTEPISKSALLMELLISLCLIGVIIKGYKTQAKFKKNLSNQMIIKGSFKILEKRITNQHRSNTTRHNVLRIFSELENKDKFIYMDNDDFKRVNVDDVIYLEYFTDCDLIKVLELNNRKLDYTQNQISNNAAF